MGGGVGSGMLSPGFGTVPTGAPQKMIGTPFKRSNGLGPGTGGEKGGAAAGQGPSAGFDGIAAPGFTKFAKSTRQFSPGSTIRIGVNPGQITKLLMWL